MSQPRIFVSHSHKDDEFTQRLVDDLHKAGAEVWVDVAGITHGNFMQRIDEALAHCEWMVLVLTPNAIASPYVKDEVYAALHRVKQGYMCDVIPVLTVPCAPGTVPPQWDVLHRYDATRDYAAALAGVRHAVGLPEAADSERIRHDDIRPELWPVLLTGDGLTSEETLQAYDRVLAADPTFSDAWEGKVRLLRSLGRLLRSLGRYEESLVAYDRLLALSPGSALFWNDKGEVLQRLNRHAEALSAFDRAIVVYPKVAEPWQNRAITLRALGRETEAQEAERAFEVQAGTLEQRYEWYEGWDELPDLWLSKGDDLLREGKPEGALAAYELALDDDPEEPDYLQKVAEALRALGREAEAQQAERRAEELQEAARREDEAREAYRRSEEGLQERARRAEQWLQEARRRAQESFPYDHMYAHMGWPEGGAQEGELRIFDHMGWLGGGAQEGKRQFEALSSGAKAVSLCWEADRSRSSGMEHAEAFRAVGHEAEAQEAERLSRQEALAFYERALALDPTDVVAWTNMGNVLSELGRNEEALAACDKSLALDPHSTFLWANKGEAWRNKAVALRALGREAEAQEAERHAKESGG